MKRCKKALKQLMEKNHKVILSADMNDDVGMEFRNQWNSVMEEAGMRHVLQGMHNNRSLPRTYNRGVRYLDTIVVSENIPHEHIKHSGILPFYSVSASDHRALYIDLDANHLFNDISIDTTKHTYRRFTAKNVKKCEIYLNQLTNLMGEARIFQKIKDIKKDIKTFLTELEKSKRHSGNEIEEQQRTKLELHQRLQTLDTKRCQLILAAEKKFGTRKGKGMFWYSDVL